jgi:hypothetical protein
VNKTDFNNPSVLRAMHRKKTLLNSEDLRKMRLPDLDHPMPEAVAAACDRLARISGPIADPIRPASAPKQTGTGKAAQKKPRRAQEPNRTEREYEAMLYSQYPYAKIKWEAYTLRLADRCRYTPDWAVVHPDGRVEFHEVKGAYVFPKSLVKPRLAAVQFPQHLFILAQKLKSGWEISELSNK